MTNAKPLDLTRSHEAIEHARRRIPGGVNSPVRAFGGVGGNPPFIARASGSRITDIDGNEYVDFVGSWGPMILGHAHPRVLHAIKEAADRGTSFGAPTEAEVDLAALVAERMPGVEMLRLVNSGTEATMSALRLARAHTNRNKFIKFEGCYHGHGDAFLVQAGSGAATLGVPNSPGVPEAVVRDTLLAPYNDLKRVKELFHENPGEIAAVIVEPVAGNMGCVPPQPGFLEGLRQVAHENKTLLILDEVMTGFRVGPGGAQERYKIRPDITTLGKIIGGGLPVGAYGGSPTIMDRLAPVGPVYQAGTLSGNPLAVAAGLETLRLLGEPGVYRQLEAMGDRLERGLNLVIEGSGYPLCVQRVGAMFCLYFNPGPVRNYTEAGQSDLVAFARFFHGMLERGIYLAPSQFEAGFLSLAHTEADIDRMLEAGREVLASGVPGPGSRP
jgi:glutamate-1-semialdehyde 2,1-aminomutase